MIEQMWFRVKYQNNRSEQNMRSTDQNKISEEQIRTKYQNNRSKQNIRTTDLSEMSYRRGCRRGCHCARSARCCLRGAARRSARAIFLKIIVTQEMLWNGIVV